MLLLQTYNWEEPGFCKFLLRCCRKEKHSHSLLIPSLREHRTYQKMFTLLNIQCLYLLYPPSPTVKICCIINHHDNWWMRTGLWKVRKNSLGSDEVQNRFLHTWNGSNNQCYHHDCRLYFELVWWFLTSLPTAGRKIMTETVEIKSVTSQLHFTHLKSAQRLRKI